MKENVTENNVYPNPVKNTFSLTREVKSGVLYNTYGAQVYEFKNTQKNIDISHLLPGLYLLKVMYKDYSESHLKLLKE